MTNQDLARLIQTILVAVVGLALLAHRRHPEGRWSLPKIPIWLQWLVAAIVIVGLIYTGRAGNGIGTVVFLGMAAVVILFQLLGRNK